MLLGLDAKASEKLQTVEILEFLLVQRLVDTDATSVRVYQLSRNTKRNTTI